MKIAVELTKEEIKLIRERQINQMQMIQAGLEEREPFDFIVQKILNAFENPVPNTNPNCGCEFH